MTVRVNTQKYEWVYSKKPRGKGFWAFRIGALDGPEEPTPAFITGHYFGAKQKAVDFARSLGESKVTVLP